MRYPDGRFFDDNSVTEDLSRPLQLEIREHICSPVLKHLDIKSGSRLSHALADSLSYRTFVTGARVIQQGEIARSIFFIISGRAHVVIEGSGGNEMRLTMLSDGHIFGHQSVISRSTAPRCVTTARPDDRLYRPSAPTIPATLSPGGLPAPRADKPATSPRPAGCQPRSRRPISRTSQPPPHLSHLSAAPHLSHLSTPISPASVRPAFRSSVVVLDLLEAFELLSEDFNAICAFEPTFANRLEMGVEERMAGTSKCTELGAYSRLRAVLEQQRSERSAKDADSERAPAAPRWTKLRNANAFISGAKSAALERCAHAATADAAAQAPPSAAAPIASAGASADDGAADSIDAAGGERSPPACRPPPQQPRRCGLSSLALALRRTTTRERPAERAAPGGNGATSARQPSSGSFASCVGSDDASGRWPLSARCSGEV